VICLVVDVNYRQDMPTLLIAYKYSVLQRQRSTAIFFFPSRVQHLRSAIMDLHMLFAGMFDFDSTGNSTKHTYSFQDINAFTLIIEDDQAKPARGGAQSLIANQKSALHEAPTIGNRDSSK
jgi:hypothetical protein